MSNNRAERRRAERGRKIDTNFLDNYVTTHASRMAEIATTLLVMGIPVEVLHEALDNANKEYLKQKPEFDKILKGGE
jgi:hypothetical protein